MKTGLETTRERWKLGAELAVELKPIRTVREVAKILRVTPAMVSQIEYMALWKVAQRMRQTW